MSVTLVPITKDNVGDVVDLTVGPGREHFVATNAWSLAQADAEREIAWPGGLRPQTRRRADRRAR